MRRQSRSIRTDLEGKTRAALADGSAIGLGAVAFVGVAPRRCRDVAAPLLDDREVQSARLPDLGASSVSCLRSGSATPSIAAPTASISAGSSHVTSAILLLVFAGWLLAKGLEELAEAGVIPENEVILWGAFALLAAPTLWFFFRPVGRKSCARLMHDG